ncbi:hypothetical protein FZEAL_8401 [Fusarium zealandicum]|uniref:LysM domain-containing protein n=1 Tax=Fusarium zealandicum TaxID=1053134 RepID=A0A8H4XHP7_9HYPO|nr:hypothetical protein FZEAL_8401 [Fusarium zealandicum]
MTSRKSQAIGSLLCLLAASVRGYDLTYNLGSEVGHSLIGADEKCRVAFYATVSCPAVLGDLIKRESIVDQQTLDSLCTDSCFGSLIQYRDSLQSDCGSAILEDHAHGSQQHPQFRAEAALLAYHRTCLKRRDGMHCNDWWLERTWADTETECSECRLMTQYHKAASPAVEDPEKAKADYMTERSSCGFSGPELPDAVPNLHIHESDHCSYPQTCKCKEWVKPRSQDTWLSLSLKHKVSTWDLTRINGRDHTHESLHSGSRRLCIVQRCQVYIIKEGDTCDSITEAGHLGENDLVTWNPTIKSVCKDLSSKKDQTICVTDPLGDDTALDEGVPDATQDSAPQGEEPPKLEQAQVAL